MYCVSVMVATLSVILPCFFSGVLGMVSGLETVPGLEMMSGSDSRKGVGVVGVVCLAKVSLHCPVR